jgi:hypothetical protein
MAYTAQSLITRSWYLSGIVARNLQVVTGDQITDGLALLNALLDFKQIETELIPYFTYLTDIFCVQGQEKYFIPNCALIQSVTFNIDTIRYPMDYTTQRTYFGSGRVDNIQTLPFNWTFVRELGGGNLFLYFVPDSNYQLKIFGKFFLVDVTLQTDLSLVVDTSYIEYLRYALAEYMCSEYGILFSPQSKQILTKYQRKLMYYSPPDLSTIKSSILTADDHGGYNYGDVNIGHGWRPS